MQLAIGSCHGRLGSSCPIISMLEGLFVGQALSDGGLDGGQGDPWARAPPRMLGAGLGLPSELQEVGNVWVLVCQLCISLKRTRQGPSRAFPCTGERTRRWPLLSPRSKWVSVSGGHRASHRSRAGSVSVGGSSLMGKLEGCPGVPSPTQEAEGGRVRYMVQVPSD